MNDRAKRSAVEAVSWLAAAVAAAAALYVLQSTARAIWSGYLRVPLEDHMTLLYQLLASPGRRGLGLFLWEQYEDHRMPLNKLALAADVALSHGRGTIPFACQWFAQAFSALSWTAIYGRTERDRRARAAFAALMTACAFSARQWLNLARPDSMHWSAALACSSAALALGLAASRRDDLTLAAGAVFCAVTATSWDLAGALVWPVLFAVAALEGASRRVLALTAGATSLASAVYFKDYALAPWHSAEPLCQALAPRLLLGFFGVAALPPLLRWPLGATGRWAAAGAGALACATGVLALHARDRRRGLGPAASFFAYELAYLVVVLLAVALGRAQLGLDMALLTTYKSVVLLGWAALTACAAASLARRLPPAWRPAVMPSLSLAVIASLILSRQDASIRFFRTRDAEQSRWGQALALGLGHDLAAQMNSEPAFIDAVIPILRQRRLFMFSRPPAAWLGRPLREVAGLREGACSGSFDALEPMPLPGSPAELAGRVIGTGREASRSEALRSVLIADRDGEVVGAAVGDPDAPSQAWSGYARARRTRLPLRAYAVLAGSGDACPLGEYPRKGHGT